MYICMILAGLAQDRYYHPMIQTMDYSLFYRGKTIIHNITASAYYGHLFTIFHRSSETE